MKTVTIRAKSDTVTEVLLYDEIGHDDFFGGGISAKTFREQIKAVKAKVLNLRVNSPGGSVTEAAAMLRALDEHPARVEVDIDGLAASAASVVAMAGEEVRIAADGIMMIHNPWAGVMGGAEDMRRLADLLDKMKEQMLDRYATRAKASREQLAEMMDAETWLTGAEAVEVGLADSLAEPLRMAARADLSKFKNYRNVPEALTKGPLVEAAWEETRKRQELAARLVTA
jgi:ATP-dependent Clp protease protease subunit